MSQKLRQDAIVKILKKQKYATVKDLVDMINYSSATINRDLNNLEKLGVVIRSYGGVELTEKKLPALPYRYDYMKKEKRHIGREGAKLISNGDVVFIGASTTTEYLASYLMDKKDITVITHDLKLALLLGEEGINVICLGGKIIEAPSMLAGLETIENSLKYHTDKVFISVGSVTPDGKVNVNESFYLIYKNMIERTKEVYLLVDNKKISNEIDFELCNFSKITGVISDYDFPPQTKLNYPNTKFICVKN